MNGYRLLVDEKQEAAPAKPLAAESSRPVSEEPAQDPDDLTFKFDTRSYRVRGLTKNTSFGQLKVNVFARRGEMFHTDTFDLYQARPRYAFIKHASIELEEDEQTIKRDLGKVLLKLETMQEDLVRGLLEPKPYEMSPQEREEAMALLEDPRLIERVLEDLERAGLIGEETNKLTAYLAVTSRKLKKPLAALVQSSSAAGKSSLMDAVLAFVPDEDKTKYSAITGQSLYYMKGSDLRHKVLAIAEEEGAERASYALKLLQSEGELCIASTGKDAVTGKLVTEEYKTEGPVMLFLTTTATNVNEELKNRCLVLAVSESREQTRRIHQLQRHRATLDGQLTSLEKARIQLLHQNAQRLLEPLLIANPFAEKLTFHDHKTRTRRDHDKYLTLIASIALLHQHQRPVKEKRGHRYVEVRRSDIDLADKLLHEVLGRSLDELPPQTRRVLELIEGYVAGKEMKFTRRDLREATSLGDTQLKIHLARLVDLEYLVVEKRGRRYHYELVNSPATGRTTVAHRSA